MLLWFTPKMLENYSQVREGCEMLRYVCDVMLKPTFMYMSVRYNRCDLTIVAAGFLVVISKAEKYEVLKKQPFYSGLFVCLLVQSYLLVHLVYLRACFFFLFSKSCFLRESYFSALELYVEPRIRHDRTSGRCATNLSY